MFLCTTTLEASEYGGVYCVTSLIQCMLFQLYDCYLDVILDTPQQQQHAALHFSFRFQIVADVYYYYYYCCKT